MNSKQGLSSLEGILEVFCISHLVFSIIICLRLIKLYSFLAKLVVFLGKSYF